MTNTDLPADRIVLRALGALAHESRLAVCRLLVVAGPDGVPAGEIAEQPGISPAGSSFPLKDLSHAGPVDARHAGRFVHYSANFGAMHHFIGSLADNCCNGQTC